MDHSAPFVVSIQGPHAVGKSTLLAGLGRAAMNLSCRGETVEELEAQKVADALDISRFPDFCLNQRRFIRWEVARYRSYRPGESVVVDRGADSTEFFTLTYPRIIGADWDVEKELACDLRLLRACKADRVLYLHAREDILLSRAVMDPHPRPTLRRWLREFEPLARDWFAKSNRTTFLDTSLMRPEELADWVERWITHGCRS